MGLIDWALSAYEAHGDDLPAALFVLVEEDAPGGDGTAADGVSLGVVHIAQFTVFAGGL